MKDGLGLISPVLRRSRQGQSRAQDCKPGRIAPGVERRLTSSTRRRPVGGAGRDAGVTDAG